MKLNYLSKLMRNLMVITATSLITGSLLFSYYSREQDAELASLRAAQSELLEENSHLRFISDLSIEFAMSPQIVEIVDHYSQQHVNAEDSEWRLIRTPEFMTHIMLSLIHAESGGEVTATGDSGRARGLTQIWLSTARQYGDVSAHDLLDPETNIKYSFQHFHSMLKRYKGNLALALYAWNRGQGTVDRLLSYGETPDNGFGRRIYRAALRASSERLKGGD